MKHYQIINNQKRQGKTLELCQKALLQVNLQNTKVYIICNNEQSKQYYLDVLNYLIEDNDKKEIKLPNILTMEEFRKRN